MDFYGAEAVCERFVTADISLALPPHLVIHGLVKSGKSTVLNYVLPAVVRRHIPDALFWRYQLPLVSRLTSNRCQCGDPILLTHALASHVRTLHFLLTLADIDRVWLFCTQAPTHPATLKGMLREGRAWAFDHGIAVDNTEIPSDGMLLQCDLLRFVKQLGTSGRTVFVLLDEIQRFFAVQEDPSRQTPANYFKEFVSPSPSPSRGRVFFAVTGSSMVQAWLAFRKAAPNGHTLLQTRRLVSIPCNEDKRVEATTCNLLRR